MIHEELNKKKVICMVCNTRHFPDENTFLTFYGNVTIGTEGGIIGNNFNEQGELCRVQYVCHKEGCITKALHLNTINTRGEI